MLGFSPLGDFPSSCSLNWQMWIISHKKLHIFSCLDQRLCWGCPNIHATVFSREKPRLKIAGLNKPFQHFPGPTQSLLEKCNSSTFCLRDPRADHAIVPSFRKLTDPAVKDFAPKGL